MKLITLITLFTLLASCSAKKKGTPTSLKFFSSAITASVPINGGVFIVGKSSNGESFSFGVQTPSQEVAVDLSPGDWEFAALAWSGEFGPPNRKQ